MNNGFTLKATLSAFVPLGFITATVVSMKALRTVGLRIVIVVDELVFLFAFAAVVFLICLVGATIGPDTVVLWRGARRCVGPNGVLKKGKASAGDSRYSHCNDKRRTKSTECLNMI